MFAIKIMKPLTVVGVVSTGTQSLNYQMISCDNFDVQYPENSPIESTGPHYPIIGIWIQDGEDKRYEGYEVSHVAYIINANGKTIDTVRPS